MNTSVSSSSTDAKRRSFYILATALAAAIGAFFIGFDGSISSAAITYLSDYFHLAKGKQGFFQGCGLIGFMIGPLAGGYFCDRFGREKTMIAGAFLMTVCALAESLTTSLYFFIAMRIGTGPGRRAHRHCGPRCT